MQATATHVKAVMVPIPWEIINDGGTIKTSGFKKLPYDNFAIWTIKRSPIIKRICLELIIGFSLLEISTNMVQQSNISVNVTNQLIIEYELRMGTESILNEEITDINMHRKKIIKLSMVANRLGIFIGSWVFRQNWLNFFNSVLKFCTEYK